MWPKYFGGKLTDSTSRGLSRTQPCRSSHVRGASFRRACFLGGNFHRGQFSGGDCLGGNCPDTPFLVYYSFLNVRSLCLCTHIITQKCHFVNLSDYINVEMNEQFFDDDHNYQLSSSSRPHPEQQE